jgi:hypothetical protein
MRVATIAGIFLMIPNLAFAGGEPLGSSSAGSLYMPSYSTVGKATGNRVTTIKPRGSLEPAGVISRESDDLTRGGRARDDDRHLLERHLDCFSGALPPDRDTRNSFTSRCPGNSR